MYLMRRRCCFLFVLLFIFCKRTFAENWLSFYFYSFFFVDLNISAIIFLVIFSGNTYILSVNGNSQNKILFFYFFCWLYVGTKFVNMKCKQLLSMCKIHSLINSQSVIRLILLFFFKYILLRKRTYTHWLFAKK